MQSSQPARLATSMFHLGQRSTYSASETWNEPRFFCPKTLGVTYGHSCILPGMRTCPSLENAVPSKYLLYLTHTGAGHREESALGSDSWEGAASPGRADLEKRHRTITTPLTARHLWSRDTHFTEDICENRDIESSGLSVAPSQRYILGNLHLPVLGKRDFANVNGYRTMKRDQCGLKALNQTTSAIIGDTQHTGKQGEALRGRKRNLLAHSQPQEYLGETGKTISPGVLGRVSSPTPQP